MAVTRSRCAFDVTEDESLLATKTSGRGGPHMERYIAFDVETPNHLNDRMSSIGITVVQDGEVEDEYHTLVNPESRFDLFNTRLTGISAKTVQDAPTFPKAWEQIEPVMSSGLLVAHNAVFDLGVLRKCLDAYGIAWKARASYLCTAQMGRRLLPGMSHRLDALCEYYGIDLDHHRAESDSRACAQILLRYLERGEDIQRHIRTYSFY